MKYLTALLFFTFISSAFTAYSNVTKLCIWIEDPEVKKIEIKGTAVEFLWKQMPISVIHNEACSDSFDPTAFIGKSYENNDYVITNPDNNTEIGRYQLSLKMDSNEVYYFAATPKSKNSSVLIDGDTLFISYKK